MTHNTKDWIQYALAVAMVTAGILLSFLSFFLLHLIHSTVLAFVGEAVGFAGAVFGLAVYARGKAEDLDQKFQQLRQELRQDTNTDTAQP